MWALGSDAFICLFILVFIIHLTLDVSPVSKGFSDFI